MLEEELLEREDEFYRCMRICICYERGQNNHIVQITDEKK
jgi:hypothetical protein